MKNYVTKFLFFIVLFTSGFVANAQTINLDASKLVPKAEVYFSPRSGSFVEGSTFDVPIFINTKGSSINSIEVRINFDKNKLSIVKPSGGISIIDVWVEPPSYDNTKGTASYVGVIPNGIVTDSGLIGTITFKTKGVGKATVSFGSNSRVLLNDGLGTEASVDFGRAEYNVLYKAPDGVNIFSETHPFQGTWYNNNSPIISWDQDPLVEGFSYVLDDKPSTIPPNEINTKDTSMSFENLEDGIWYFHIKANKKGVWGNTGHFLIKIDTAPPAIFKPEINYLLGAAILVDRILVSFYTTDNLSGVDHYEVGVIDKTQPTTVSPVFVQAESPFQIPTSDNSKLRVIVRAVDSAGNIRDSSIDVSKPWALVSFVEKYALYILLFIIIVGVITLILHYIFGHHIIRKIRQFKEFIKKEDGSDNLPPPPQIPTT